MMSDLSSFEYLKDHLTDVQRKILTAIWEFFLQSDNWMKTRILHHRFDKDIVRPALEQLGGSVVRENAVGGNSAYELTFLGMLLTEQGESIEHVLIRYLEFLRDKFERDPIKETFTNREIESALQLDESTSLLLKRILSSVSLLGFSGHGANGWSVTFPRDIDEYRKKGDFRSYLRQLAMERYDPALPVDERGRVFYESEPNENRELEQKFKILYSAAQANQDFNRWVKELRAMANPIAVLFIDIDHFKALNSRYTETKIDKTILIQAQKLLASLVHLRGDAYRQGGDEFVVVLPNHTTSEATAFGERVRLAFETTEFLVEAETEKLTVSGGIAFWPEHGSDYENVLQRANEAKNSAKATRNTIHLFRGS